VAFLYGSDHQRIREVSSQTTGGVASQKTLAILHPDNAGSLYFERETINTGPGAGTANAVQNRHYLSAEKGAFLLITSNTSLSANPTPTTLANVEQRYWHKDHLGSIVASTNANLTVIERLAYEPFGKRRFANGQYDQAGSIEGQSTNRGFTGHEHLDSLDFIHMNARVYDPDIGRFLSPDPTVPGAHNPQAFNRYAYAFNSPLNLVDPDGFEPRAADGSFADGGHRGANSGPSSSGPSTSNNGTPAAGNAISANQPSKSGVDQIPGFVGPVPEPDEKPTGWWSKLASVVRSCDACNKVVDGLAPGVAVGIKTIGAVSKMDKAIGVAGGLKAAQPTIGLSLRNTPLGFSNSSQYTQAMNELTTALARAGITDAQVGVRGSSVTGIGKNGAFSAKSDIDFFVISDQLTQGLKTQPNIPGFVHPDRVGKAVPSIANWSTNWSETLGRSVSVGGFKSGAMTDVNVIWGK
jgi:RHS repeat-associated protein